MPIVVQKYGGSSVADEDKIKKVARKVAAKREAGYQVVVTVSAMGDTTDELLALAKSVHPDPPRRELDMLLTCGERISMALLSMALQREGVPAISFTGSQSGIITNDAHSQARIVEVRPFRIQEELAKGKVVIVAGYQGVSYKREVTTLGRGGTDTTAVALAAALGAEACEIYSDVDGVFSADPRVVLDAKKLETLSYEEMQELAVAGAKVLNAQAVEFARDRQIVIHALSAHGGGTGSLIGQAPPGAETRVKGITADAELCVLHAAFGRDRLGELLEFLDAQGLPSRAVSFDGLGERSGVYLLMPLQDVHGLETLAAELQTRFDGAVRLERELGSVTCVGVGVGTSLGPLRTVLELAEAVGARVHAVYTSALQVSVLVPRTFLPELTRRLHQTLVRG